MHEDSAEKCLRSKIQVFHSARAAARGGLGNLGGAMAKFLDIAYSGLLKGCELSWWKPLLYLSKLIYLLAPISPTSFQHSSGKTPSDCTPLSFKKFTLRIGFTKIVFLPPSYSFSVRNSSARYKTINLRFDPLTLLLSLSSHEFPN